MVEENTTISGSIRDEALYYISIGLPVIPLCSPTHKGMSVAHMSKCKSPGKAPLLKDWSNWNGTSREDVLEWFRNAKQRGANINIGIPLGSNSNMIGLDIDGEQGEIVLKAISNGDLPSTWEFSTGNGRRILYKLPPGLKTKKISIKGEGKHEEFAILCDGTQTVLPPSCHPSGKLYQWKSKHSPRDIPLADCPSWILQQISKEFHPQSEPVTEEDWEKVLHEGERNNGISRLAGSEFAKGNSKEEVLIAINKYNQNFCDPPLPDTEIATIIESIGIREEMSRASKAKIPDEAKPKKPVLRPTKFIKDFLIKQKSQGFVWKYSAEMGIFFRCDENVGPWKLLDIDYVKSEIRKPLINHKLGGHACWDTSHSVNECLEALKAELVYPGEFNLFDFGYSIRNNTWEKNPLSTVCLNNGIYDWKEKKLYPWSAKIYTTIKLPVDFDPEAKCLNWEKTLNEWIPYPDTVRFLQEFIGLCLIPDTSFRTAVFLYGTGSNGKSMFLDTIRNIFGDALVSIPLHRLANRFETVYLQNKLINICGDIDAKYMSDTGIVRAIIGGDTLHGEIKHGKSYDFIPVARLMFSANKLPQVADKTYAWYSRWKFIEFPATFPINPAYKIEHEMIFEKEKSGILNWALEGLVRLKAQNRWTESHGMKRSEISYRSENDNVTAFLEEYIEKVKYDSTSETLVSTKALYRCYADWMTEYLSGSRKVSMGEFSRRVQSNGFTKTNRAINGRSRNVFLGMQIKEEFTEDYQSYLMLD